METSHTPKRHISRCKETYIYGKLLQCIKRDLQKNPPPNHVCRKRPVCIKRDLYIWKETYTRNPANTNCVKTNIYEKRLTKEIYIHKRIPTYLKRDHRKKPRKHQLCRDQYLQKRPIHTKGARFSRGSAFTNLWFEFHELSYTSS